MSESSNGARLFSSDYIPLGIWAFFMGVSIFHNNERAYQAVRDFKRKVMRILNIDDPD